MVTCVIQNSSCLDQGLLAVGSAVSTSLQISLIEYRASAQLGVPDVDHTHWDAYIVVERAIMFRIDPVGTDLQCESLPLAD